MKDNVLIFDSGVGGLSIYSQVRQYNPDCNYLYLFDNKYCPYGLKDETFLKERVFHLLDSFIKSYSIDLIVIACNTASTIVLDYLRERISIPVVGVVPAIKPAALLSKKKVIGLLATPGTVHREYTQELINRFAKDVTVLKIGSTKLVELAEKKISKESVSISEVKEILTPWIEIENKPDVIILGCTHFSWLREEIEFYFKDCLVIDSSEAIAKRVYNLLKDKKNLQHKENKNHHENCAFCTVVEKVHDGLRQNFNNLGFKKVVLFDC